MARCKSSMDDVNKMKLSDFRTNFEDIVQSADLIVSALWSKRPFKSVSEIHTSVGEILDGLPLEVQEAVLRGFPELATKQSLSRECTREQRSAGLRTLSSETHTLIDRLNAAYTTKFGFPFVICARENKVDAIIKGLLSRVENSREQEVATGIAEAKKICWLRLCDIVYLPHSLKCRL